MLHNRHSTMMPCTNGYAFLSQYCSQIMRMNAINNENDPAYEVRLNLTAELAVGASVRSLIDRLDLLLTYGDMSGRMRQILIEALEQLSDPTERAHMAIHLISISPEYAVVQ